MAATRVLIVEDYQDARAMYAMYLRTRGYDVDEAASGVVAVRKVARTRPDVIIMDLTLPDLDGIEATRRIRGRDAGRRTPIIALTGQVQADRLKAAEEAGCVACLIKPCLPNTLADAIERALAPGIPR